MVYLSLTVPVLAAVAYLNVWPRAVQLWNGAADTAGWSIVVFQILCLFLLAQIPFAISRTSSWVMSGVLAVFAVTLIAVNLSFSIESIGFVRDAARDHNRQTAANVVTWTRQRDDARAERKGLPTFSPTTDAQVASAKQAVEEARKAKDQECSNLIGFHCC